MKCKKGCKWQEKREGEDVEQSKGGRRELIRSGRTEGG